MLSRWLAIVLLLAGISGVLLAQGSTSGIFLQPAQYHYFLKTGFNPIPAFGPANLGGFTGTAYMSLGGFPPDMLTQNQISHGFNFSLFGATFLTRITLNAQGDGTFGVHLAPPPGGGDEGVDIMPGIPSISLWLAASSPAGHFTINPTPVVLRRRPTACSIVTCGSPGVKYQGPTDVVPPNLPDSPACGVFGHGCTLTVDADQVTCPDALVAEINVPRVWLGNIEFECLNSVGTSGEAGEITYGILYPAVVSALASGKLYVDLVYTPTQEWDTALHYPVKAVQTYCPEWLWLREPSPGACEPAQICSVIIGDGVTVDGRNQTHGFKYDSCDPSPWKRANGVNIGCLHDYVCPADPDIRKMRIRYRAECIKAILDDVNALNPGFFTSTTVVFIIAGTFCHP